jgi:hypothetical protein
MKLLRTYPKKLLWWIYFISLGLSLLLNPWLLHSEHLHYHYPFQSLPEFFAAFGLVGCMALILVAKGVGFFISKDEDYYEKRSEK